MRHAGGGVLVISMVPASGLSDLGGGLGLMPGRSLGGALGVDASVRRPWTCRTPPRIVPTPALFPGLFRFAAVGRRKQKRQGTGHVQAPCPYFPAKGNLLCRGAFVVGQARFSDRARRALFPERSPIC